MTKREKFNALLTLLNDFEDDAIIVEGFSAEDACEFISHEIDLLDKKNAVKGEKKPTEKQKQNADIGEMVMSRLKSVDEVAYVRFASVYRSFKDINTFMDELTKLLTEK